MSISEEFVAQIYSIIEINRSVIPEMAAQADKRYKIIHEEVVKNLTPDERGQYFQSLTQIHDAFGAVLDDSDANGLSINLGVISRGIPNRIASLAIEQLMRDQAMRAKAGSHEDLLRSSLLVSAVSSFEVLFGQIARKVYSVNSAALNDSDHSFTLQELAEFKSLDDAREYLIERRISSLLRDSIESWEKWLKRATGGVSMESLQINWPTVREAFARRNLIVHTGGVVNQIYLSIVQKLDLGAGGIPSGGRLKVEEDYLDAVLQELLALGRILSCTVGSKLHKSDQERFTRAATMTMQDLSKKRAWRACESLCLYVLTRDISREQEMRARVSLWLTRKNLRGLESVREEVERWDTSGLTKTLAHCKSVLLEDEEAVAEVRALLDGGQLTKFELIADPLYENVARHLSN
ncbi:hypothetical protein [Streptomyces sp. NPDC002588]|uniref:hypothetical protein n=1 Tax=Streptomyces sp. NPDC002588 TaxID=3154419 RepID=UPI003328373E